MPPGGGAGWTDKERARTRNLLVQTLHSAAGQGDAAAAMRAAAFSPVNACSACAQGGDAGS